MIAKRTILHGLAALFALTVMGVQGVCATESAEERRGRLANGLTYYVRHTDAEPGRASLNLVQNVGSLMEEESQRGLAHFLEHMAFNASKHFPGRIDRFLQRHGLVHFNAYTGHDETVYTIGDVPTGNRELLDSCMLVVRDWCHYLTLPEEGISKERGIITEERRMRRTATARVREQILGALYNNSRYSHREVIGLQEVIDTFSREDLANYYKRWYRPDLQAVVAVGDFDAEKMERFIKEHFASLPKADDSAPEREIYTIPPHAKPRCVKVVDSELEGTAIAMTQRVEKLAAAETAEEVIRRVVLRESFNSMLEARIAMMLAEAEGIIRDAAIDYAPMLRGYDALSINVQPYPGRDFMALYEVFRLWECVRRLGFTEHEFRQQMRRQLRQAEAFDRNLDKIDLNIYAGLYQYNFLQGIPVVEPAERGNLMRKVIAELTLEDLHGWMERWSARTDNRLFIITGNDPEYGYLPLEAIVEAEEEARESGIEQPDFAAEKASLMDFTLAAANVTKERRLKVGDAVEWSFGNGARVIFKQTDIDQGRIRMTAYSPGGMSLVADEDVASARAIESLAFASGVYHTNRSAMIPLMQNHDLQIAFRLQERREAIMAEADSDDAELMFELLHLGLTNPRFDESEFLRYKNSLELSVAAQRNDERARIADTLRSLYERPTLRTAPVDSDYVARLDLDTVRRIFRQRFCAPEDFVFYMAGDLTEVEARDLAARYIGTLPRAGIRPEKAVQRPSTVRRESYTREFEITGADNKASIDISFTNNRRFNLKHRTAFWLAGAVLNSRSKDEIRDRRGGTYDINVDTRHNGYAVPRQWLTVRFETTAARTDEMRRAFYTEWEYLLSDGVTAEDVASIVGARKEQIARERHDAGYWITALNRYIERGEDITHPDYHSRNLDRMTPRLVHRTMERFRRGARKMDIVVKTVKRSEK